ncbi:phosphatase PAP2 family protein [Gemmatimonadota bacterium]
MEDKAAATAARRSFRRLLPGTACLAVLLSALSTNPTLAQDRPFPYALGTQDLLILPIGFGLSEWGDALEAGLDLITYEEIEGLTRNDVNAFDRVATRNWSFTWDDRSDEYRDTLLRSAILLLFVPDVIHGRVSNAVTIGTMFAETYFVVRGVTLVTKSLVGRKRPYAYNTSMSATERYNLARWSDDGVGVYESFFSGHSAAAFTLATLMSKITTDVYGRSTWTDILWASSLSLATMTAYARVKAGVHYPSDVIVGAIVGGAIGYLIPTLHRKESAGRLSLLAAPDYLQLRIRLDAR